MASNQTQRPQFFEGQYLGSADLTALLEYARMRHARHELGAHTWGIAAGLQLIERSGPNNQKDLYVLPGHAWDGFGRTILLLNPYKIPAELFKDLIHDAAIDGGTPKGRLVDVWLRYRETQNQSPKPGFESCDLEDGFARVEESFTIVIGARESDQERQDLVSVAGYSVLAQEVMQKLNPQTPAVSLLDASVSFQELPAANESKRWLIPLGQVRWLPGVGGTAGQFIERELVDLTSSEYKRIYTGVVAGSVQAAGNNIRIRSRTHKPINVLSDDLVWIEGNLRLEGDQRLFGHKISFLNRNGQDEDVPLELRRGTDTNNPKLEIGLGKVGDGKARLAIGWLKPSASPSTAPSTFQETVSVLNNGKVGVGTTVPDQAITIVGPDNAFLNLKAKPGDKEMEVLIGVDVSGGILSTMTDHDLQLRAGVNKTFMTIKKDGNVGIGTGVPGYKLDVADRMRVRQGSSPSAGIWFHQNAPNADRAFVGMASDDQVGFWGKVPGFGLRMDINSGNVGINCTDPGVRLPQASGSFRRQLTRIAPLWVWRMTTRLGFGATRAVGVS
jgi:hypothetical protein